VTYYSRCCQVGHNFDDFIPGREYDAGADRARPATRTRARPVRGLVRFAVELRNQRDELVQEGELTELITK